MHGGTDGLIQGRVGQNGNDVALHALVSHLPTSKQGYVRIGRIANPCVRLIRPQGFTHSTLGDTGGLLYVPCRTSQFISPHHEGESDY